LVANLLQRLVEVVLFFHPAVWWISRRITIERENACDDAVLRLDCPRLQYAEVLLWDVASGEPRRTFDPQIRDILSLSFSPDGQSLLATGKEGEAKLWSILAPREK
jgi:hypothetical protein